MIWLETPRLVVRDHRIEDLPALHAVLSDPAVTWYLPDMRKRDIGETERYLRACLGDIDIARRARYNLAITTRQGEYLGDVGLHAIDGPAGDTHCGLGYFVRADRWNRGYAAEAVDAALDYIFRHGARRVSASCLAENLASRRVLEKCGFTREGQLKAHTWHEGEWKDCAVYRLLKEEYTGRTISCSEK